MNDLRKEDGYILVVVIGILTILSLMTITFATLSRIETRATRNYADSVKCENIAKAGLEHAIYVLRQDKFGYDDVAYDSDPPDFPDENYDWSGETWMSGNIDLSNPLTSFAGNAVGDCDNDGDLTPESKWIYFPATLSTSNSDIRLPGKLRARYAVLITDDKEARVNVNVTGNQPGDEGTSTTEIDMSSVIELVPGLSPADGDNISSSIISTRAGMPFGVLTEAEIVGISGTSTAYTSRLEEIFESYIGSGWETAYEDRKGTLTAFSADTIVCPEYLLEGVDISTMLNINALIYNESAYADTGAYTPIRKIAMIIDVLTAGGVPDVERQQMAVNIIDFIDSDNTVTQYDDGSIYYGIEKTPYINEVEAWTNSGTDEFIELFNPYDSAINIANWTITLDGSATIITLTGPTIPSQDYYVIADQTGAGVDQVDTGIDSLDSSGEQLTLKTDPGSGSITVQVTDYGSANETQSRQLNDPRPIPLSASASNPWFWESSASTIGAPNSNFNPTGIGDNWTLGTYPSSFFIANRRFSNKGYMGYIHRGSEWSSFKVDDNITYPDVLKYITITDPSMDGIDNDGDVAKDSTDTGLQAGDIDGKEHRIPGLINVNTASNQVLQSLPNIGTSEANAIIGGRPFKSIGEVANVFTGISGDKWNREKPFRAISNLITTRSNVFTVYVTAQVTEEDISDPPNTNVYAEKKILAIVDRSVDPIKIRYFRWITE